MFKKIAAAAVAITCTLSAIPVMAQESEPVKYIALGDSITAGHGLSNPETQSYPAAFAALHGLTYENYGVDGMTSDELLTALKNKEYPLENAKVITVSIGSNDILQPVIEMVAEELQIDTASTDDLAAAITDKVDYMLKNETINYTVLRFSNIEDNLKSGSDFSKELYAICDKTAQETIPQIKAEIRAQNPDAQVIFTNIYNPYYNMMAILPIDSKTTAKRDIGSYCQPYVARINKGSTSTDDIKVADLASIFTKASYVNASLDMRNMDTFTFDPHPNIYGHMAIKNAINALYVPEPNEEPDKFIYGDVDDSKEIDVSDAALVFQYVLNKSAVPFDDTALIKADVDLSGEIDSSDAAEIFQKTLVSTYKFKAEMSQF